MQHIMKNNSHDMLVGCTSIFETEHYDYVMKITDGSPKRSLYSIEMVYFYLIVATKTIYKGKC